MDRMVPRPPLLPLADTDVRFVGDPIALVVATSRYIAEDACELIDADIEPLAAGGRRRGRMAAGAPRAPRARHQRRRRDPGAPDAGLDGILATAAHVVTRTFCQSRTTNVPMEGRGLVASWDRYAGELARLAVDTEPA